MPIKPENRHHYQGEAWQKVRAATLARAGNRCELCFLPNGQVVYRDGSGQPYLTNPPGAGLSATKIVLTCAHINQDPADNREVNVLALCQRCHLRIDLPYKMAAMAAARTARKAALGVTP